MVYCTQCGHPNPEGSNFCGRCGEPLIGKDEMHTARTSDSTKVIPSVNDEGDTADLTPDEEAAVRSLPQGSALLIVRRGPGVGSRFLLDSEKSTAGRHPSSDIFLDDITVSRHHVEFTRTGGGVVVRDLGSLNGTYVNRRLIDADVDLQPGDEVQIGKFRMVFYASAHGLN